MKRREQREESRWSSRERRKLRILECSSYYCESPVNWMGHVSPQHQVHREDRYARERALKRTDMMTALEPSDDIPKYLESLESFMSDAQIPMSERKHIVHSKLPTVVRQAMLDLTIDMSVSYLDYKRELVANMGFTWKQAATLLFTKFTPAWKGLRVREFLATLRRRCLSLYPEPADKNTVFPIMRGWIWDRLLEKLPLAQMALRMAPARDTGLSPYQIVYGRQMRTPLDILRGGWRKKAYEYMDMTSWTTELADRLESVQDMLGSRGILAATQRKKHYDNHSKCRELARYDTVLYRRPGMTPKLQESWVGPFKVVDKFNKVNYRIATVKYPTKTRVAHINDLKPYNVDPTLCTLQVMAEDIVRQPNMILTREITKVQPDIQFVLAKYPDIVNDTPGTTTLVEARIDTDEGRLVSLPPYRIPEAKRQQVKKELAKLVKQGILVKRDGPLPWCWLVNLAVASGCVETIES